MAAIRYSLDKQLKTFCDTWQDAIREMGEDLDEILIDNGIEMAEAVSSEYWNAVEEAESRISEDGFSKQDVILCELEKQLSKLENGTIGNAGKAAKVRQKIVKRKEEIRQECFEKYGVSPETVKNAEDIGGQGHGRDKYVAQIIEETLKDILGVEDVPGGGQQGDDSKIAEEAEQAENEEGGETASVAKDILGGFDGKLSVEVLENWFK